MSNRNLITDLRNMPATALRASEAADEIERCHLAMMWRSMESAPLDGTRIIVTFVSASEERKVTTCRHVEGRWRAAVTRLGDVAIYVKYPIAWMPAPAPFEGEWP